MSLPIPNLDDKTFEELFEEARSLIPRYSDWTDYNFSDPGITFIDLFAWLAEIQIYRLNRVNNTHKIKYLKLLGTAPKAAVPATVDVTFEAAGLKAQPLTLPAGTQVAAADPDTSDDLIFETDEALRLYPIHIARVLTRDASDWVDNTTANSTASGVYFAFGKCPARHDALYLGFDTTGAFPDGELTLTINVYDADLPAVAAADDGQAVLPLPSADLTWQFWNGVSWQSLALLRDDTVALTRHGRVAFNGPESIQRARIEEIEKGIFAGQPSVPLYWVRVRVTTAGYEIPPRLETVLTNTISATQGHPVFGENLNVPSLPCQTVRLRHQPIVDQTLKLELLEEDGQYHLWHEVPDFDASAPNARHYTIDLEQGLIRFGDGIRGRIPPPLPDTGNEERGNARAVQYRFGGGENGNVLPQSINRVLDAGAIGLRIQNIRAASGGTAAESPDDALDRVRKALKKPTRTIHAGDIERLALATPGLRVARAKALLFYHPDLPGIRMPGAVTVVIVPYTKRELCPQALPKPSRGFLQTIDRFLQSRRLLGTQLHVTEPAFIRVEVEAHVQINPRFGVEQMTSAIRKALNAFLDPVTGGNDGEGWPFGRTVFKSEIYRVLAAVNGVECVDRVALKSSETCPPTAGGDIRLPNLGLVYSGVHTLHLDTRRPPQSRAT